MTERSKMRLHPFKDCVAAIKQIIDTNGHCMPLRKLVRDDAQVFVYQQFNCRYCGVKQTMAEANVVHTLGKCEECGHCTDIEADGMNYAVHFHT